MIQHIKSYKALEIEVDGVRNTEHVVVAKDKGKQKEIGFQIKSLQKLLRPKIQCQILMLN